MRGALEGVRVLDFGRYIAGPYCTCLLGDLGAEVIRVERVGGGEDRFVLPLGGQEAGAMFLPLNRNKKSVAIEPNTPQGRAIVEKLIRTADVVCANLPPQGLKAMGLDYDTLRALKPDIILTSLNAFGSGGPWSERLGFDGIAQVMSGLCYMSGQPGQPTKLYGPWADFSAGQLAALGTLAALMYRKQTGQGQHVEGSLLMAAMVPASGLLTEQAFTGINRQPSGNRSQTGAPADMYRTRDGWIIAQVVSNALFKRWARLMGEPYWLTDERFKDDDARVRNSAVINERMGQWCAERTTAEALAALEKTGVPAGPLLAPQEVLDHEHVKAVGAFEQVDYPGLDAPVTMMNTAVSLSATPGTIRMRPPLTGEHTDAILSELGVSKSEIAELRGAGVL
ncbi:MAG: CoA transferase [Steroidobacteraceae bacterium]